MYYFICEKWFAVEEEDEKVEREIMVSDHGLGFTKVIVIIRTFKILMLLNNLLFMCLTVTCQCMNEP